MDTELLVEVNGHVAEPFLLLKLATVHVALRPHPCRTELGILGGAVQIRAEG